MTAYDELLPYRLRTVRVGVLSSVIAIVLLTGYPLLADDAVPEPALYYLLLAVAAAAVGIVAVLPWRRLFATPWGIRLMYAWSIGDILIISGELAITGGGRSELWVVYILTTIFFAASYPVRGQVALLAFTGLSYAVASAAAGELPIAALVVRCAALGMLTFMGSFLSRELMGQMGEHQHHRRSAERHAEVLDRVVGAARRLQSLDTGEVLDAVVDTVTSLGLPWAGIAELDREEGTFRLVRSRGLPANLTTGRHEMERALVDALSAGMAVTSTDPSEPREGWEPIRGFVVAPIHVRGEVVAILGGATLDTASVGARVSEAVELLASLAGRGLELAATFEKERESVRRLERLDQLKRDFISNVSHELRTPLTVMMGVGELLKTRWAQLAEETRVDLLDRQLSHVASLNRTIGTLLDFSRLEAGRLSTRIETTDVVALVVDAGRRLDRVSGTHRIEIEAPDRRAVLADPDLIERVVDNLVINALTHTPPGTTVRIRVADEEAGVRIEVADDGPGIPPEDLPQLTDRFFRGGDPDTRPTRGLGLGLALVHEILEQHGAHLEIRSEPGLGARFSFLLGCAESAPVPHLVDRIA